MLSLSIVGAVAATLPWLVDGTRSADETMKDVPASPSTGSVPQRFDPIPQDGSVVASGATEAGERPVWRPVIDDDRIRMLPRDPPPDRPIADLYAELSPKANAGDGEAAYFLYEALHFCASVPTTEQEYDDALLDLLTTRKAAGLVYLDDTTRRERFLARSYELCRGVAESMQSHSAEFLRIAADSGISDAQIALADAMVLAQPGEEPAPIAAVMSQLRRATESGNADACFWSGFHGLKGPLSSGSGRSEAIADLIVAEAAYAKYGIRKGLDRLIENEYRLLRPREREEVADMVEQRVSSARCCFFSYGRSWREILGDEEE